MLFLRATPLLPNTFINVAAPIAGVPVAPFVVGTLLGCLPNNFVAVSAGSRLGELTSLSDLYDAKMVALGANNVCISTDSCKARVAHSGCGHCCGAAVSGADPTCGGVASSCELHSTTPFTNNWYSSLLVPIQLIHLL